MNPTDHAATLALFLTERTGSCFGQWSGRLPAAEQRSLFGRFLGKGTLYIDGRDETIAHYVKTGFGLDSDCTATIRWMNL